VVLRVVLGKVGGGGVLGKGANAGSGLTVKVRRRYLRNLARLLITAEETMRCKSWQCYASCKEEKLLLLL
jgi:hypothetical protein